MDNRPPRAGDAGGQRYDQGPRAGPRPYAARGRLPIRVVGAHEAPQHVTFGRDVSPSVARATLSVLDARGRPVRTVRVAPAAHDADFL